jgi:hypothetical protein
VLGPTLAFMRQIFSGDRVRQSNHYRAPNTCALAHQMVIKQAPQSLGAWSLEQFIDTPPSSEISELFCRSGRLLSLLNGFYHSPTLTCPSKRLPARPAAPFPLPGRQLLSTSPNSSPLVDRARREPDQEGTFSGEGTCHGRGEFASPGCVPPFHCTGHLVANRVLLHWGCICTEPSDITHQGRWVPQPT